MAKQSATQILVYSYGFTYAVPANQFRGLVAGRFAEWDAERNRWTSLYPYAVSQCTDAVVVSHPVINVDAQRRAIEAAYPASETITTAR